MRKESLTIRLHSRETTDLAVRSKSYRKLYSDRRWINDLDLVNELDGHSGCVNALSWSKSGRLLVSGSDDQHLNVHTYQPDNSDSQFQLTATVATGHTQNIFSVKFMPHSSDRIVITAAGDSQVRVLDLEYAGQAASASTASLRAAEGRRRGRVTSYSNVRYLSDGDTNVRVYRSHGDRVKRIVTESSPYLFLTCSEDGEIRQWDCRQPSSAYPEPRGSQHSSNSVVPPPLISYKRYGLDLNTISCSATQPHYILLGGAHLHAFLHDRRMTGRDRLAEMGKPLSSMASLSPEEQELLAQATQCVRKFAPQGQKTMSRSDNGHITACKISDARPNEAVISWSGDHIYSFDLNKNPDDFDQDESIDRQQDGRIKSSRDRKRKRQVYSSQNSLRRETCTLSRTHSASVDGQDTALRIRYQNGQTEDIPIPDPSQSLTERQREAQRIAKATVQIRSSLFGPQDEEADPTVRYTSAIGRAASILTVAEEVSRAWGYPLSPHAEEVYRQTVLRRGRERTRRFIQAAGTLSRVLGGKLQTLSGFSPMMAHFAVVEVCSNDLELPQREQFCYDFMKAILLWLDSGIGRLIEGFSRPSTMAAGAKTARRLPISEEDQAEEVIHDTLIPYLLRLAGDDPIIDVQANRFETDETRHLFGTEVAAVAAFAAAVRIPFEDLSSTAADNREHAQDRQTALRFWAGRVARGLLLRVSEGLDFANVDRSFGGLGSVQPEVAAEEALVNLLHEGASEDEETVGALQILNEHGDVVDTAPLDDLALLAHETLRQPASRTDNVNVETTDPYEENTVLQEVSSEMDEDDGDSDGDDDSVDAQRSDTSSEPDEEDGVPNLGIPRYIYRPAFERRRLRSKVEPSVSCGRPTRTYRGHCNVRTVKDVNFFGPDDDFVVSGSDDGNFFIWDRKTAELVNVLEGDGEVVNVIEGHPYETMMAVSGIDHTIKIFSPDARAREVARLGRGISAHDTSDFSSLAWPTRIGRRRARRREFESATDHSTSEPVVSASSAEALTAIEDDDEYVAPNGLSSRKRMHQAYQIMQQNDVEREGNNQQARITLPHAQLLHLLFGQLGNAGLMPSLE